MNDQQFPILKHGIYANHAAIAPWPLCATQAVANFAAENARQGPEDYRNWISRERQLRQDLASFIGAASRQDIALVKNTSEGISLVAFGLPLREGDNIVLPKGEFSSNRLPWLAQSRRGVEVREVPIDGAQDPEAELLNACDHKTRVLSVSAIQYLNGLRHDLERLGGECRRREIVFFVDAIQQLGALPINVDACHIDCLAAGAHKWLLGPEGIGVFYCSERVRSKIALHQVGWHMFDYPWNFDRSDWEPATSANRFEAGSPNTLGQVALAASLGLINDETIEVVSSRVLANTAALLSGLDRIPGVHVTSDRRQERRSGIVSFQLTDREPRDVFRRLRSDSVACALRKGAIRLSPHFYQAETEMEKLLLAVDEAIRDCS